MIYFQIIRSNRAMAVCIALMCGRLGAVAGANIFAVLIDNYCDLAFLVAALSQFGKFKPLYISLKHFILI